MFYFYKMQATGNDFILINCLKEKFEYSFKLLAEFLCDRHYGVGADGLIIIDKSEIADFRMRIFNNDGSEAEMCGNGIRCFAKYVYEHKLISKDKFKIDTLAGIKEVFLLVEGETVVNVKVDMGTPIFEANEVPVIFLEYLENDKITANNKFEDIKNVDINSEIKNEKNIDINGDLKKDTKLDIFEKNKNELCKFKIDDRLYYALSMGNPHTVCFVEDIEKIDIEKIGKMVEEYKFFPNRTNVEFIQIIDKGKIKIRVWERGVGETLSCGTGACAAAIVSKLIKSTNSELIVDLKGGNLKINYDIENQKVFLQGDANEVFKGELKI